MDINGLLQVMQLSDSMLPVGAFSFSSGLESAVAVGMVKDAVGLGDFVLSVAQQTAAVDGLALLHAFRAARDQDLDGLLQVDQALYRRKLNEETRTMSVRMGKKLAEMGDKVFEAPMLDAWLAEIKDGRAPGSYAVGQGTLFADLGLSESDAFAVHQYGVAAMIVGAALRLMRVDHLQTQRILNEVNAHAAADYEAIAELPLEDMAAFYPALDILSAVHVKAHVRMFMN